MIFNACSPRRTNHGQRSGEKCQLTPVRADEMGCEFIEVSAHAGARLAGAGAELRKFIDETGGKVDGARTGVPEMGYKAAREADKTAEIEIKGNDIQKRLDTVSADLREMNLNGTIRLTGKAVLPPKIPDVLSFDEHPLEQISKRKIDFTQALKFAEDAILAISQRNGTQHAYYSEEGFIVIRTDGTINTVGWLDDGGRKVIEVMKKHGFNK